MHIGDNDIYVSDTGGDGPILLFVHGILMDHSVWEHQVAAFAPDHRVVCVDLRGFGKSSTTSPDIGFEDHVVDLLTVIDRLGSSEITLIGWSMGGAIAQVLAAQHPDAVARIVLVDSTPQLLADDHFPHALPVEAAQQLGGALVEDFAAGCAAFAALVAPEDAVVSERLSAIAAATRPDVALAAFQSSGARNQLREVARITTPTAVICGEADRVCMPEASDYLADAIPGCVGPATKIEGAGHAPFMTRPDAFNAALAAALK